jgi:hypothetical protein
MYLIPKNNIVTGVNKRDTKGHEEWKHSQEFSEENVREDDEGEEDNHYTQINRIRESDSQKKNLKEIARKLWLAVEVGDKLGSLKILKSQPVNQAQISINCTNTDGWAPLHVAASEGHV